MNAEPDSNRPAGGDSAIANSTPTQVAAQLDEHRSRTAVARIIKACGGAKLSHLNAREVAPRVNGTGYTYGWIIQGQRHALLSARLACDYWFATGDKPGRKPGNKVRSMQFEVGGRLVKTTTQKHTSAVQVIVYATKEEEADRSAQWEALCIARRREDRAAAVATLELAEETAQSIDEWRDKRIAIAELFSTAQLRSIDGYGHKRVSDTDRQRIVLILAQLRDALCKCTVIVNGESQQPHLRIIRGGVPT